MGHNLANNNYTTNRLRWAFLNSSMISPQRSNSSNIPNLARLLFLACSAVSFVGCTAKPGTWKTVKESNCQVILNLYSNHTYESTDWWIGEQSKPVPTIHERGAWKLTSDGVQLHIAEYHGSIGASKPTKLVRTLPMRSSKILWKNLGQTEVLLSFESAKIKPIDWDDVRKHSWQFYPEPKPTAQVKF